MDTGHFWVDGGLKVSGKNICEAQKPKSVINIKNESKRQSVNPKSDRLNVAFYKKVPKQAQIVMTNYASTRGPQQKQQQHEVQDQHQQFHQLRQPHLQPKQPKYQQQPQLQEQQEQPEQEQKKQDLNAKKGAESTWAAVASPTGAAVASSKVPTMLPTVKKSCFVKISPRFESEKKNECSTDLSFDRIVVSQHISTVESSVALSHWKTQRSSERQLASKTRTFMVQPLTGQKLVSSQ